MEICHQLGIRFMQLSYNNQSLLATGCYEAEDPGITRMGRQVIREMNRVGLVIGQSTSVRQYGQLVAAKPCVCEDITDMVGVFHSVYARWR